MILEPIAKRAWPPEFWERLRALGPVSDAFVAAVDAARPAPDAWRDDDRLYDAENVADRPNVSADPNTRK